MTAAAIALLIAAMMDGNASVAQRNDACYALRGQRSAEVVSALKSALADKTVRACAARDLREAGAIDALIEGLNSGDADTQMAAARELGELHDPRALEALGSVALSDNVLLASSAISALGGYEPTVGAALPAARRRPEQRVRRDRVGTGGAIARSRGPRRGTPRS